MIHYQLNDDEIEDITDAEWDQIQQEERHQLEENLLKADPGFVEFLRSTYSEPTHTRRN
jgi:hypothetical protein